MYIYNIYIYPHTTGILPSMLPTQYLHIAMFNLLQDRHHYPIDYLFDTKPQELNHPYSPQLDGCMFSFLCVPPTKVDLSMTSLASHEKNLVCSHIHENSRNKVYKQKKARNFVMFLSSHPFIYSSEEPNYIYIIYI